MYKAAGKLYSYVPKTYCKARTMQIIRIHNKNSEKIRVANPVVER